MKLMSFFVCIGKANSEMQRVSIHLSLLIRIKTKKSFSKKVAGKNWIMTLARGRTGTGKIMSECQEPTTRFT